MKSLRALDMTSETNNDMNDTLRAHQWVFRSSLVAGDSILAGQHAKEMMTVVESLKHHIPWQQRVTLSTLTFVCALGAWNMDLTSERTVPTHSHPDVTSAMLAMFKYQLGDPDNAEAGCEPWWGSKLCGSIYRYNLGDFDKGYEYCTALRDHSYIDPERSLLTAWSSRITGERKDLIEVERLSKSHLADPELRPNFVLTAHCALGMKAVIEKDGLSASSAYSALKPHANSFSQYGILCIDRMLGLLAQTMGNFEDAKGHFEDALAFCRKAGYRPELAWSLYDFAALRQAQGEREEALTLLDEALSISNELGMRPIIEKATKLRHELETQPATAPGYPDGLTGREVEVLRLVAAGRSNREIGEELFIALNTVARHVSNIFSKTDSSNRAEAATYANQHNLL